MPSSKIFDIAVPSAPRKVLKLSLRNQRLVRRSMHHPGASDSRNRRAAASVPTAAPGGSVAAPAMTTPRAPRGAGQRVGTTPVARGPRNEEEAPADVPTRASPPRAAKDRANQNIHDQLQQREQVPILLAEVVVDDDAAASSVHSSSSSRSSFSEAGAASNRASGEAGAGVSDHDLDALGGFDFSPADDADNDDLLPTDAEVSKYTFF